MSATPFDSPMLRDLVSDPDAARLFSAPAELRAMLLVEGALARAQGALGLIPETAAAAIHRASREVVIDPAALAPGTAAAGVPVPAFVAAFRAAMGAPEHAAWVHFGATSQDIVDTALALRLRAYLDLLDARLLAVLAALGPAAARHRALPMAARTRGQAAAPASFGARIAIWGAPLLRARTRLAELRPRLLQVSLAGAAGTLAAMGPRAAEVPPMLAAELGLAAPDLPWHAARDGVAELGAELGLIAGSLGKFGLDLTLLGQSEVGELAAGTAGGSSTMPNKANPVAAEALVALGRHAAPLAGALSQAMLAGQERDGAAWLQEWLALPQLCLVAAGAARHAAALAADLRPDPARMKANMLAGGGLIMAEAAAFRLVAEGLPRPQAQALVARACKAAMRAQGTTPGGTLVGALAAEPEAAGVDWAQALDPARHLGLAPAHADRFAALARDACAGAGAAT
ncbi:MAG: lyase family protein [Pseudomonadota bacterium]|nr:lyase family protein [Pseudomonadota bacterium]